MTANDNDRPIDPASDLFVDLLSNDFVPSQDLKIPIENTLAPNQHIRVSEDVRNGCGGKIWEAASVLCSHLAWRTEIDLNFWKGKRTLELGSGTGAVGIFAFLQSHKAGGLQTVLTDMSVMVPLMQQNVLLNFNGTVPSSLGVAELKWYHTSVIN